MHSIYNLNNANVIFYTILKILSIHLIQNLIILYIQFFKNHLIQTVRWLLNLIRFTVHSIQNPAMLMVYSLQNIIGLFCFRYKTSKTSDAFDTKSSNGDGVIYKKSNITVYSIIFYKITLLTVHSTHDLIRLTIQSVRILAMLTVCSTQYLIIIRMYSIQSLTALTAYFIHSTLLLTIPYKTFQINRLFQMKPNCIDYLMWIPFKMYKY